MSQTAIHPEVLKKLTASEKKRALNFYKSFKREILWFKDFGKLNIKPAQIRIMAANCAVLGVWELQREKNKKA